jgi:hypothetical protein
MKKVTKLGVRRKTTKLLNSMKKRRKKRDFRDHPNYPQYDYMIHAILNDLAGIPVKELAKETYLSAQTIRNARKGPGKGGTRYPRGTTMQELARLAGGSVTYNSPQENVKPITDERKLIPFIPRRKSA